MAKIESTYAWHKIVNGWFYSIEEGDRIEFRDGFARLYNSAGCEIDSVFYK